MERVEMDGYKVENRPTATFFVDEQGNVQPKKNEAEIADLSKEAKAALELMQTFCNPITRSILRQLLDVSDREARRAIEELREHGYRVISSSRTQGYWLAKSENDYKAFRAEYAAKAETYLRRLRAMDAHTEGQVAFNG